MRHHRKKKNDVFRFVNWNLTNIKKEQIQMKKNKSDINLAVGLRLKEKKKKKKKKTELMVWRKPYKKEKG